MKFLNHIVERSNSPLFFKVPTKFESQIDCPLPHLHSQVSIYFNLEQKSELLIKDIYYQTSLKGEYLGVLDYFIELLQGRAIESIDRINAKEFDYFVRQDKSRSSFEYYNQQIYEILALGEKIYLSIRPSEKTSKILRKDFFYLAFSEQLELVEECLAVNFYKHPDFTHYEIDITSIEDGEICVEHKENFTEEMKSFLKQELITNLLGELNFQLVFR